MRDSLEETCDEKSNPDADTYDTDDTLKCSQLGATDRIDKLVKFSVVGLRACRQ